MEWYYEHNGQQAGPVSRAEIIRLILQRRIHPHTLVWTPEFGDQWRPASKAGLIAPLSVKFMTSTGGKVESPVVPPAMGKKDDPAHVPVLWSWFILLPGLLNYLLYGLDMLTGQEPFRGSVLGVFFLGMILMTAMILDRKALLQHGYKPPTFLWFLLWGLCPPCYLWSRYFILKRGMTQAILAVLMWAGMVGLGGYYLYQHPELIKLQFEHIQGNEAQMPSWLKKDGASKRAEPKSSGKETPSQNAPGNGTDSSEDEEIQL